MQRRTILLRLRVGAFLALDHALRARRDVSASHDFTMNNNDPPGSYFPGRIFRMEGAVLPEKEGLRRSAAPVRAVRLLG